MGELANKAISVAVSPKEFSVLELLRAKRYCKIEILLNVGEITQVYAEEEISTSGANVEEIINSNAHQTVTIAKHDGDLSRIKRRIPIKP